MFNRNDNHQFSAVSNFIGIWFCFIFGSIVLGVIWNAYQYSQRPNCTDGILIRDDAGIYRCVPASSPIIFRGKR